MTNTDTRLILEILKKIQGDLAFLREDSKAILLRLNKLEVAEAHHGVDAAELHGRVDRLSNRIDRLERRLDITD